MDSSELTQEPAEEAREAVQAMASMLSAAALSEKGLDAEELAGIRASLAASDLAFVRVLEDLITVLLEKNLLLLTDLPEAAQDKIMERQEIRSSIAELGNLVADDDEFDGYI